MNAQILTSLDSFSGLRSVTELTKDQLIQSARTAVKECSVEEARAQLEAHPNTLLLDVREPEEVATGSIALAKAVPRGFLELRIEDIERNRDRPIIIYCAGGTRSVLAGRSLQEMGYRNVTSMKGGFGAWKNAGFPWKVEQQLSSEQKIRYSRHIMLPEIGEEGQKRLLNAKVLLVGAGGLGSPSAFYLAAAGVGTLGVVDPDVVDYSNLQRQILHRNEDAGVPKVDSAERAIRDLNPDVKVVKYREFLTSENIMRILDEGWELVVDGCDNFQTRYLINDACVFRGLPNVHGSIFQFEGQVSVFAPKLGGPCYRCLYPEPPPPGMAPSCAEAGVVGALPGIVGTMQVLETVKLLLGKGTPLVGRLAQFDALAMKWREMKLRRDPECPVCSEHPTITTLIDYEAFCSASR
ncbi:MAG: molybdopterin-synthase adenylyltransferase MoeB [Deltaproteobacteria bacterium]|nr:molybdopterin-synthase adenylyltransferase MoeB [Deltaproteobacteria bacterium]